MSQRPHLSNAPILEAILDIKAALPAGTRLERLATMHGAISDRYPKRRTRKRIEGVLDIKSEGDVRLTRSAPTEDGYMFHSQDGKRIVQARLDGFTFNQLKPYETWEKLRDEAKEHWALYLDIARPESVNRIALRFINRMELPLPFDDFKDFFNTTSRAEALFQ